jgi:DNA-binding NtrC family response regulator
MTDKEFQTRLGTPPSYHAAIKSFEHDLFEKALRKANKSPSKAARLVGLPHTSFIKRLTKHPDLAINSSSTKKSYTDVSAFPLIG